MQKNKVEILRNANTSICWTCEGLRAIYNKKKDTIDICPTCNGTGIFVETHYYHIFIDKKGNKCAIDSDTLA